MKAEAAHRVPLSSPALAVLMRALPARGSTDLIFPDRDGQEMMSENGLRKLLGNRFPGKTVHGFRSTFRDWFDEKTEFPRELGEHSLAHVEGSETERAYSRTDFFDKRREVMDTWGAFVTGSSTQVA